MRIEQQPSYLLHGRAYGETSLLLEVFSRDHGRVGLLAKGVRSARRHSQRALLQPGQPLLLDWTTGYDLPMVRSMEAGRVLLRSGGDGTLALFYVNELLLRLLPRDEPALVLFDAYASLLEMLSDQRGRIWALRCFERDLLATIGYALILDADVDGEPIDPSARYSYVSDEGPRRLPEKANPKPDDVDGSTLIALRDGEESRSPNPTRLRHFMRTRISEHLAGKPLHAWRLAPLMGSVERPSPAETEAAITSRASPKQ